jgi:hypothetical protein
MEINKHLIDQKREKWMKKNEKPLECTEKKYFVHNAVMFRLIKMPGKVKFLFNVLSYFAQDVITTIETL